MNISVMSVRTLRQIFATIAVLAMVFSPFANVQLADASNHQIRICHANGGGTYSAPNPTKAQIYADMNSNDAANAHGSFVAGVHPDDIIPPFAAGSQGNNSWGDYPGKNWDAEGQAIWNNNCAVPAAISITALADLQCGVQDVNIAGFVTFQVPTTADFLVIKLDGNVVVNDADIDDAGPDGVSQPWSYVLNDVSEGNHTIEAIIYDNANLTGVKASDSDSFSIPECPKSGTLSVVKEIVGTTTVPFSTFSFQIDGGSSVAFDSDGQIDTVLGVDTYSVTEVVNAAYTTTYSNSLNGNTNCDNLAVTEDTTTTCTITNTLNTGSLTIYKETDDASGDAIAFAFTGDAGAFDVNGNGDLDSQTGDYETFSDLPTGSYTITETDIDGWTPGLATCDVDSENGAKWSSTNGSLTIEIEKGDNISCAFTNTKDLIDDTTITINKVTNIESEQEFDFYFGDDELPFTSLAGGETSGVVEVEAGFYSIYEDVVEGWDLNEELSSCVITGTDDVVGSFDGPYYLEVNEGDDITCTFYNDADDVEIIEMCKFDQLQNPVEGWGMTLSNDTEEGTYELVTGENGCVSQTVNTEDGPWYVTEEERAGWNFVDVTVNGGDLEETEGTPACEFFAPKISDFISLVAVDETPSYNCSFYNEEEAPVCEVGNNLLANGSFEDPIADQNGHGAGFWEIFSVVADWTSSVDEFEIWNNMFGGASEGDQNIELDGDGNAPTTISQVVSTIPGAIYELRFDFSARPDTGIEDNSVDALVDGTILLNASADGAELSENDWNTYSQTFEATDASTEIAFADVSTENENSVGALVDNAVLCLVREPETPSYSQGSYGGGNGTRISLRDGGGDSDDEPEGEVLGEATSTLPVGAPNTGNGGASASLDLHMVAAILGSRRGVKNGN